MKNFLFAEFLNRNSVTKIALAAFFALSTLASAETIKDKRDGQTYKIIKLDGQEWIAENLRYSPKGAACTGICKKMGMMYNWHEAMEVCPEGWVLPSHGDWARLFNHVGGFEELVAKSEVISQKYVESGKVVKVKGKDVIGFGALTYGQCAEVDHHGVKQVTMNCPIFWTSTDNLDDLSPITSNPTIDLPVAGDGHVAYALYGYIDRNYRNIGELKKERLPVRCISEKTHYRDPAEEYKELLEKGLVDKRDNHVYPVTLIQGTLWMAKNLNYQTKNSWCYDNDYSNCALGGRLYSWAAAMGKSEEECGRGKNCNATGELIQGICPEGWHLPTMDEFHTLSSIAGFKEQCEGNGPDEGPCWHEGTANNLHDSWDPNFPARDTYGFNAQGAGTRQYDGQFVGLGDYGFYWTSDEFHKNYAKYAWLYGDRFYLNNYFKDNAFSVRCVKNR